MRHYAGLLRRRLRSSWRGHSCLPRRWLWLFLCGALVRGRGLQADHSKVRGCAVGGGGRQKRHPVLKIARPELRKRAIGTCTCENEARIGSGGWGELRRPGVVNRLAIAVTLQFFQQWTGINVIMYYAADLFAAMGLDAASSRITFVLINSAINWLATYPGMYLVERTGRRPLLIWGGVAMGGSLFAVIGFVAAATAPGWCRTGASTS